VAADAHDILHLPEIRERASDLELDGYGAPALADFLNKGVQTLDEGVRE